MMERGLATTSASSLGTLGCISLGPVDLCMFSVVRWSQTQSAFTGRNFVPFSACLGVQVLEILERNGKSGYQLPEAKNLLIPSAFSMAVVTSILILFNRCLILQASKPWISDSRRLASRP